jgi:hypothetical protein
MGKFPVRKVSGVNPCAINRKRQSTKTNPVFRFNLLTENTEQTRMLSQDKERLSLLAASQPLCDVVTLSVENGMHSLWTILKNPYMAVPHRRRWTFWAIIVSQK